MDCWLEPARRTVLLAGLTPEILCGRLQKSIAVFDVRIGEKLMNILFNLLMAALAVCLFAGQGHAAPNQPELEALLQPVMALAQKGELALAEQECSKVIRKHPKAAGAYTLRANLRLKLQKTASALEDANQAIRLAPDWSGGRTGRALILMALGRYAPALQDLDIAILKGAQDPGQAKEYRLALFYRADYFIRQGKLNAALRDLNRITQNKPDQISAIYSRGTVLVRMGRYEDAVRDLNQVVASGLDGPPLAGALTSLAQAEANLGRIDEAMTHINQAVKITSANPFMHGVRGQILQKKGKHAEAVESFNKAIKLEPRYLEAVLFRGNSYMALGEYAKAAKNYSLLISKGSKRVDRVTGHLMRSKTFVMRKMYKEALDDLEQVPRLAPEKELGYAELARFLAGCPNKDYRDPERAYEMAVNAAALNKTPDTLAVLAAAQAAGGDFEGAVINQQKALSMLLKGGAPEKVVRFYEKQLNDYQDGRPFRLDVSR